jgi:hypothetical protein
MELHGKTQCSDPHFLSSVRGVDFPICTIDLTRGAVEICSVGLLPSPNANSVASDQHIVVTEKKAAIAKPAFSWRVCIVHMSRPAWMKLVRAFSEWFDQNSMSRKFYISSDDYIMIMVLGPVEKLSIIACRPPSRGDQWYPLASQIVSP